MTLILDPQLADSDAFYERLIDAHNGLEYDASVSLNARLVATLREQVRDDETLQQADALASSAGDDAENDARLILLLANHLGNTICLDALFASARSEHPKHTEQATKPGSFPEAA